MNTCIFFILFYKFFIENRIIKIEFKMTQGNKHHYCWLKIRFTKWEYWTNPILIIIPKRKQKPTI